MTQSGEGHHFLPTGKRVCLGPRALGCLAAKCVTVFGGLVAAPPEAAWLVDAKRCMCSFALTTSFA